jgi:hypothetical protein
MFERELFNFRQHCETKSQAEIFSEITDGKKPCGLRQGFLFYPLSRRLSPALVLNGVSSARR